MKVQEILNNEVSILPRVNCKINPGKKSTLSIYSILFELTPKIEPMQNIARELLYKEGKNSYKEYKTNNLPVWFPAGQVLTGNGKDSDIVNYSNVMAIDIDDIPESDLIRFREDFFKEPYVISILKSLSGKGLYALIYVEDGKKTKQYYKYIQNIIKKKYNISIDPHACNIARKRFVSFDENMEKWIKPMDCNITPWKLYVNDDITSTLFEPIDQQSYNYYTNNLFNKDLSLERTRQAIWALLESGYTTDSYFHWYHIGCDFVPFSDGEAMWEKLCSNYGKQTEKDPINTWKSCKKNPTTIDDDFHRKWQGMAKNRLGENWWKKNKDE